MHQLLLLRHAKASLAEASQSDRDRPLNASGRRAAATLRRALRTLGLTPDLILVSTARRTLETLDALEPWDDTPLTEPMEDLYLASETRLLEVLRAVPETVRAVLLIGHNPGLHQLALTLTDPRASSAPLAERLGQGFPTAALAELTIAGPWPRLDAGQGRLDRFLTTNTAGGTE